MQLKDEGKKTMSESSSTSSRYAMIGDVAHVVTLTNVLVFTATVATHRSWFDPEWQAEGFCIMNPDRHYWTSHDLCLYVDVVLSGAVGIVYWMLREKPGMQAAGKYVNWISLAGVVGHGIGHGGIAAALRSEETAGTDGEMLGWDAANFTTPLGFLREQAPFVIFWVLLLRAIMQSAPYVLIVAMSLASVVGNLLVPINFGFTYVQSVLFLAFAINEVMKPKREKGFEYALYPVMVGFPVGMIAWMESTQCKLVKGIGGHLIYDAFIPLSMLLFYLICWTRSGISNATTNKIKHA